MNRNFEVEFFRKNDTLLIRIVNSEHVHLFRFLLEPSTQFKILADLIYKSLADTGVDKVQASCAAFKIIKNIFGSFKGNRA